MRGGVGGPHFLSYQQVYLTAESSRAALAAGIAAVDAIEALSDTFAVIGFVLEQYDAVGNDECGRGYAVTLTFDTGGALSKTKVNEVARAIKAGAAS